MSTIESFDGKVVVITGAASGFGLEFARQTAAEGARVVLADMNEEGLVRATEGIRQSGGIADWLRVDVTKQDDWAALHEAVMRTHGRCDLLFHNAGAMMTKSLDVLNDDDWRWLIDVNVMSCVRGNRLFMPTMEAQEEGGKILINASQSALSPTGSVIYTVTKAAEMRLAESMQIEAASKGRKVSFAVVCPWFVWTNINRSDDYCPPDYHPGEKTEADLRTTNMLIHLADDKDSEAAIRTGGLEPDAATADIIDQLKKDYFYIYTHKALARAVVMAQASRLVKGYEYPVDQRAVKDEYYERMHFCD